MDDATSGSLHRHNRPFQKAKSPAGRWQADVPGLAEHGQLVCIGSEGVNQFHRPGPAPIFPKIVLPGEGKGGRNGQ